MQILIALAVAAVAAAQPSGPLTRSDFLLVRAVIAGDTIAVAGVGRVRLLGLADPFGREARDRLAALVHLRWVRLEYEAGGDRRRAYLITGDGVFVNAALVRDGLARVRARPALSRLAELQRAEHEAQQARRGMWATVAPRARGRYTLTSTS